MSRAAVGAWAILLICLVGWIATFAVPSLHAWSEVGYLRHGFEGAFVGGLCDAFAIWRVYVTIETEYEPLSTEVSRFVARDIIRADSLVEDVRASLDAPATAQALSKLLEERFPTRRQLTAMCLDYWDEELRAKVLEYLVQADLDAWFDGAGDADKLLDDPDVRLVLRHCLAAALADDERAGRLHKILDLSWVIEKVFDRKDLLERLKSLTIALEKPPTPGATPTGVLVRDYLKAYLLAWGTLPEAERRRAVERVLAIAGPIVIEALVARLWAQREDLTRFLGTDHGISKHPFVEAIVARLEPVLRKMPVLIEDTLRTKLASLGGRGVRDLIERNTRARLDMIQLNGTLLGLVVGVLVGVVTAVANSAF